MRNHWNQFLRLHYGWVAGYIGLGLVAMITMLPAMQANLGGWLSTAVFGFYWLPAVLYLTLRMHLELQDEAKLRQDLSPYDEMAAEHLTRAIRAIHAEAQTLTHRERVALVRRAWSNVHRNAGKDKQS